MGIKHLWTILTPFCDRKPLYELGGKTVAIDLSCWICEAQNIADYQVQPRMYLRNLYFRTCYLLLLDVHLVFVLEGKAPELKYETIAARNAIQFKGAKPKTQGVKTGKDRTRFHFVLKQCEEMLSYMGIACIKGKGEAESLCASLNADGLVDGCISQDSDCFAYGAHVVYRNFSISTQGKQAASGGSVDIYDIRKAKDNLDLGRNKVIAMALLIGSDYSDGIYGIGKDSVMKFFETLRDDEVLNRLRSWRSEGVKYETMENQLNDKNTCTSCGHNGKLQSHTRLGCRSCRTAKGCDSQYKNERLNMKNEISMRSKALQDPNFPSDLLINEFLQSKDNVKQLDLTWKRPDVVNFVKFTVKFLQWEELYAFEKILPVLTRWQCRNNRKELCTLEPQRIKKIRNPKGVPSFEIIWKDPIGNLNKLIPEEQLCNVDMEKLWSTIEPQTLVEQAYPKLVEAFNLSKVKPKGKRKKVTKIDELTEQLGNVSITPKPVVKKPRKPRKKVNNCTVEQLNSSLNALSLEKNNSRAPKQILQTLDGFLKQKKVSTPVKTLEVDFNLSRFGDESDLDVSDIIENMVSTGRAAKELHNLAKEYLKQECKDEAICLDDFSKDTDLFEAEFNRTFKNFSSSNSDSE
ncbi:hypothetical protein ABEB36_006786 [Hypothenemus hampei]|uniref:Flap endonuclease GEN n=1 Tax=Hypothenemus hampei TaxID=57062 RepID=A0ABD1ERR4_HYPHA